MKLYRFKFFNTQREFGKKLVDTYVLARDARTAALAAYQEFDIAEHEARLCFQIADKHGLLAPSKRNGSLRLFKAVNSSSDFYVIDRTLEKAKLRMQRNGHEPDTFEISQMHQDFLIVTYKRKTKQYTVSNER